MKKTTFAIIILFFFLLPTTGDCRLNKSSFSSLIKQSELILEGSVIKIERIGLLGGSATIKVFRVFAGQYDKPEITITWGGEVHDQAIESMTTDRLLFLKKTQEGIYTGSHYGRSYWPFSSRVIDLKRTDLDSEHRGFFYEYPLTMVTFSKKENATLFVGKKETPYGKKISFISMAKLKKYIKSMTVLQKKFHNFKDLNNTALLTQSSYSQGTLRAT